MEHLTNNSKLILKKICNDENFARKVLPFVKPDYFEGHEKIAYNLILDFITKYFRKILGIIPKKQENKDPYGQKIEFFFKN